MPEFEVVPPHEAGKRIRVLATEIYEVLINPPYPSHQSFQTSETTSIHWDRVMNAQIAVSKAIETRRKSEMKPAWEAYREAVRVYRNQIYLSATEQLSNKKMSFPPTKKGQSVASAIKELRDLANNLPTNSDLPSADSRDTALRAIIAVLRTHEVPGAEALTHEAKEDQSAKTSESVGGTAPAKPVFPWTVKQSAASEGAAAEKSDVG